MLDINTALMGLVALIFIFLIIVLDKTLYKPLLSFMKERDDSIREDQEKAKKNSSNVSHLEKEAQKIIHEAKAKAHQMKEEALNSIKSEAQEKIEARKKELESAYEAFLNELEKEKVELSAKINESLPSFNNALKTKLSQI